MRKDMAKCLMAALVALGLAMAADAGQLNVLTLGAKNDGSEDVSEVVNANTGKGTLYFPAGRYKVAKPIHLKNPIVGDGYARRPKIEDNTTWLISEIGADVKGMGVLNFGGEDRVNVERINIRCNAQEDGIRIVKVRGSTGVFVSQVGVFNLHGHGVFADGSGSRSVFIQDMTIFGANYPVPGVGIRIDGICDCRVSNVEIMGTRIGLLLNNGYTYGDNLHVWTGAMAGRDRGGWWKGTRSLVLGNNSVFAGSQIYLDSSYYAIEQKGDNASATISNVFYWEDNSLKGSPDYDGAFFHCPPGAQGTLTIHGGLIGVAGSDKKPGHMARVYTPGQDIRDVQVKSDLSICGANVDRLCFGSDLPDYTVRYADKGWCKVADVFTAAPTGACEAVLTLGDGAAWRLAFLKAANDTAASATATALNALCGSREIRFAEANGVMEVYVRSEDDMPWTARFKTVCMTDRFRPLNHASLRGMDGRRRYRNVIESM